MESISYKYIFELEVGKTKNFTVDINVQTLLLESIEEIPRPEWTKLENFKCPHCPLDNNKDKFCPVAINIDNLLEEFKDIPSYEKATITVKSQQRDFKKETVVQSGLSSLMGLIMAASGCPVLGKLRPMIKFHLPFAALDETEYRVFSTYLLAQYIKLEKGKNPDWEMKGLQKIYDDIHILNEYVASQISRMENKDANVNAVVILNNFADSVTISLEENELWQIEHLFKEFM